MKKITDKTFKILQIDGGGLLGIIPLVFLTELEKKLNKKIPQIFDMFIGTSTGGIASAMFAKRYSAKQVLDFYLKHGKNIFKKRFLGFLNPMSWFSGKYSRSYIDNLCDKMLDIKMYELRKQFICTGINMKDDQYTHFFKSYKYKYANKNVSEMVKRTYSAPTYFGYYKDKDGVWSDGGTGIHNCLLLESYIETLRQKKKNYYILSCGCGDSGVTYEGNSLFSQVKDFIPIARKQSIQMQVNNGKEIGINFNRVNINIKPEHDKMDSWELMNQFVKYGKKMIEENIDKIRL